MRARIVNLSNGMVHLILRTVYSSVFIQIYSPIGGHNQYRMRLRPILPLEQELVSCSMSD